MARSPFSRYADLLRMPGTAAFFVAGWFGRYPRSSMSLGIVLLVSGTTGGYALAGTVSAAALLAMAVSGPTWSGIMDRIGQRRALVVALPSMLVTGSAFLGAVVLGAPLPVWFLLAALLGLATPDLGSAVRARWTALVDEQRRPAAFALESFADETVFVVAPPVVTLLASAVAPGAGFAAALVLGLIGGAVLVASAATQPPVLPRDRSRRGAREVLPPLAILPPSAASVGIGAMFGSFDVSSIGWAEEFGAPVLAGAAIAVVGFTSGVGALTTGLIRWPFGVRTRFLLAAATVGLLVGLIPLSAGAIWSLLLATAVVGLAAGVTVVSSFTLVETRSPRLRITELLAYPSAGAGIGVTLGATFAGSALDAAGSSAGFAVTAAAGVTIVVIALVGEGFLHLASRAAPRPRRLIRRARLLQTGAVHDLPAVEFAFPGPLRDLLVEAVRSGEKTSTTSLLHEYETAGEPLPSVGERGAVVDSSGARVLVVETTSVEVVRLADVPLEHAIAEGEGDRSVASWRSAHLAFWTSDEMRAVLGPELRIDNDTRVVLERFVVIDPSPTTAGQAPGNASV